MKTSVEEPSAVLKIIGSTMVGIFLAALAPSWGRIIGDMVRTQRLNSKNADTGSLLI